MDTLNLITPLEGNLKAAVQLSPLPQPPDHWSLDVTLYYDGELAGKTGFILRGYSREDAEKVVKLIESLEDLDDVQNVFSNADIVE